MDEKGKQLEELARPLVKWLNDNFHPHVQVVITPTGVELLEGIRYVPIPDYVRD